ncbi:hypothetical protein KXX35_003178 [Aspergillus fumigatus]|nr:hypothetical protein KXX30_003908 [Aspergillus fumigatus]KAH1393094.1 hypothetical protein KXX50_008768 [Aspergillus fumigatus]KAH1431121.1 hypothetical protein KXX22_008078 [Aspergillus fumigatus]KAH1544704.1 hypothetical protein KXX37_003834 [Aspergillus fumigatus]KAH1635986.1 hypothetical protein KXX59_003769 [Aspergillus fumigatus]
MPHTRRPRKSDSRIQQQKRLQVTDAEGWTHVTTNKNVRRALRPNQSADGGQSTTPLLMPAEAPSQLTLGDLQIQFNGYRERWEGSETWRVMADTLRRRFEGTSSISDPVPHATELENIVCIGLGSPSGFLRGGWVDRRSVSLYQLAALVGVMELINKYCPSITAYAQDPVFNQLDRLLLNSLGITVLEHPEGFAKVSSRSFLYCPGAERTHLEQLFAADPPLLFGGPLEGVESEVVDRYLGTRESVRVPTFEINEHAFWNMRLYLLKKE